MSCFGAIRVKYSSNQASSIPACGNYPKVGMAIKNSYSRERRRLSTINPRFELRMERNAPGIDEGCMPEPAAFSSPTLDARASLQTSPIAAPRMVIGSPHRQDLGRDEHPFFSSFSLLSRFPLLSDRLGRSFLYQQPIPAVPPGMPRAIFPKVLLGAAVLHFSGED